MENQYTEKAEITAIPGGYQFKLGNLKGFGKSILESIMHYDGQITSSKDPYLKVHKWLEENNFKSRLSEKQRQEYIKLLEEHGIKFFSENLFLFIDSIVQEEINKIINQ